MMCSCIGSSHERLCVCMELIATAYKQANCEAVWTENVIVTNDMSPSSKNPKSKDIMLTCMKEKLAKIMEVLETENATTHCNITSIIKKVDELHLLTFSKFQKATRTKKKIVPLFPGRTKKANQEDKQDHSYQAPTTRKGATTKSKMAGGSFKRNRGTGKILIHVKI